MILAENELDIAIDFLESLVVSHNTVVLMEGDLASGKTTFVKKYVAKKGILQAVTSPTFSIQTLYGNLIFHYDIYNKGVEEFVALGLLEEFEKDGIHFVEWSDERLKKVVLEYGFDVICIKINKLNSKREYIIEHA